MIYNGSLSLLMLYNKPYYYISLLFIIYILYIYIYIIYI